MTTSDKTITTNDEIEITDNILFFSPTSDLTDIKLEVGENGQIINIINKSSTNTITFHATDSNVAGVTATDNNLIQTDTCVQFIYIDSKWYPIRNLVNS